MTKLVVLSLACFSAFVALVLIPFVLLKVLITLVVALILIPLKIIGAVAGGLVRGLFKGVFWLGLLLIPLAILALPLTLFALGAWFVFRALRPRRPPQAYVVS